MGVHFLVSVAFESQNQSSSKFSNKINELHRREDSFEFLLAVMFPKFFSCARKLPWFDEQVFLRLRMTPQDYWKLSWFEIGILEELVFKCLLLFFLHTVGEADYAILMEFWVIQRDRNWFFITRNWLIDVQTEWHKLQTLLFFLPTSLIL